MNKLSLSFPENSPRSFPFRAGRSHAAVTMYRKTYNGYDTFRIPFKNDKGHREFHRFPNYEKARAKGNEMLEQLLGGDAHAITLKETDKVVYVSDKS